MLLLDPVLLNNKNYVAAQHGNMPALRFSTKQRAGKVFKRTFSP